MTVRRSTAFVSVLLAMLAPALTPPADAATTVIGSGTTASTESSDLWSATSLGADSDGGQLRTVHPSEFEAYTLNDQALDAVLDQAPLEDTAAAARNLPTLEVPAPTGELVEFALVESPVMEDGLAAAHPDIKTYAGTSVTEGYAASIRLDVTPNGFHAAVRTVDGAGWYVDPAYVDDEGPYLSYHGTALPASERPLAEPELDVETQGAVTRLAARAANAGSVVRRRTYRWALLNDPTFATKVAPGLNTGGDDTASNAAVLAAKVTLVNRVNEIFNDDLAIKLLLIDGTDKLNLNTTAKATGANGPCGTAPCFTSDQLGDGCQGSLLLRQRHVLGLLAGADNFDVGHLVGGMDGGGVAAIGVVGGRDKAMGCSSVLSPVGDYMALGFLAHELGHQFGANHSFASAGPCGPWRNDATSVEPGGGTSIMSYAGGCEGDTLQSDPDPYFAARSQAEINALVNLTVANTVEVQEVALTGRGSASSFRLDYDGTSTLPITGATDVPGVSYAYTAAGVKAAIQAAIGGTISVTPFFDAATWNDNGFQVSYGGTLAGRDVRTPAVADAVGVAGYAGTVVQGGSHGIGGSTGTATSNRSPSVTAPSAKTIPVRTPFALTGSGEDADGDALVYTWEQDDRAAAGGTALQSNTKLSGPLFPQFATTATVANNTVFHAQGHHHADASPTRTFPDLAQVLRGATNAASGRCPAVGNPNGRLPAGDVLDCYAEFLPTADYVGDVTAGNASPPALNFRLTARDLYPSGGGTSYDDVKLTLDPTAGPFLVTSQAAATTYEGGSTQTITWAVNGTDKPALAPNVKITMSTDGGQSWGEVLAANTPNDGSAEVVIPNVATSTARIRLEAVDNYFFDVNDAPITIDPSVSTRGLEVQPPTVTEVSAPYGGAVGAADSTFSATSERPGARLRATATGLPAGLELTREGTDDAATWTVIGAVQDESGRYEATIQVTDGGDIVEVPLTIRVVAAGAVASLVKQTSTGTGVLSYRQDVALTANLVAAELGNRGDLAFATVDFLDATSGETLCPKVAVTAANGEGTAVCTYSAIANRTYDIRLAVGGRFTGASTVSRPFTLPQTRILSAQWFPTGPTNTITFESDSAAATFTCTLDGGPPTPCSSPYTWTLAGQAPGKHRLLVWATVNGLRDSTPAGLNYIVTTAP
ncbi:MAG TPA: M12 family metallo-peptidase [Nocardioides sp.]|uniref:reprolysin-like metallopeptidase n=1 Tax=uncultured Nocardioides sp. TaxID=198441 RepID=UPI000EBA9554|nr:M12 family metallo-peptidase [uncultured Nocardioides sp.]HCB07184.1 hypothetical protein [Nocardioides sp.]HRD60360.1 M12 family metallo-peptidase [Nocardioides sp.]HRI94852.1 M12 family metallo-peptidase [Nocardioides sp.]HRK44915.1 M12 family metallo-peptidase [Nocardioides sp.]